jgi:signal transduction histidine kinase
VDRAKDDLINLFSHETRTPLNAIIGFAKLLSETPALPDDEKEFVKTIIESGMSLLSLSNKAIMITTLRQEGRTIARSKVELRDMLDNAICDVPEQFKAKGVPVENLCEAGTTMFVDEHMVEVALSFVIENALKFSDSGKVVLSRDLGDDGELRISVTDEGCGIPPERLPDIFDEFGVEDVAHHSRGHGLSLAIVKLVMEAHEGRVEASPNPSGKGSRFTLIFGRSSLL